YNQPSYPIYEAVYTAANSSFQSTLQAYIKAGRFLNTATPKPLAIVAATHESHVQATVLCAKSSGLQMRIRSGGHDYEGLSYTSSVPFVILDMFNLRSVDIDIVNETAWVQSGATLGELYYKIGKASKVHGFPAGVCPTVGVGGHFSGGGYGNMIRKYGLSVDNIIDAQLVDVKGNILDRKSMGEDVFWAIRGGGGASFGVILAWKIKLVQVPSTVTVFRINRTLEQGATHILYRWQQVASKLEKEVFIRAMPQVVNGSSKGKKTVYASFIGLFLGKSSKFLSLLNKNLPELGLQQKDCHETSWIESAVFWHFPNGAPIEVLLNRTGPVKSSSKKKSDFVRDVIPMEGLERIWKMMIKLGNMWMQWNPYGGRMSEISETETPFPHRAGYLFKIEYSTNLPEGTEATNNQLSLLREMYDKMSPYVSKNPREAFLNYRDLDIGSNPSNQTNFEEAKVYGSKYFKSNFQRLMEETNPKWPAVGSYSLPWQLAATPLFLFVDHNQPSYPIYGAVYTAANSSFQSTLQAYIKNRRFLSPATPQPLAIVAATHESHAQATVLCAKTSGLQMRIRSGGHDYEGLSYTSNVSFVILDMFNLRSIDIDIGNETAWVQSGAILGELYYKISMASKVHGFPAGVCPTVGIGGHFSGGGYGTMMRKYGLSVDNIIDALLVDVNGNILDRKSMGEDVFWAIRGGGGASFGVILAWKIKLVQVPSTVTVFRIERTLEQGATHILYRWQQVASKLEKEIFLRAMPQVVSGSSKGNNKTIRVSFIGFFLGQSGQLLSSLNMSLPELGLQQKDCIEMSWVESTVFWAGSPSGTPIESLLNRTGTGKTAFKKKSDYVKNVIPEGGLERIWKMMITVGDNMWMQWNPYGGRMSEISETETPFPHRAGNLFKIEYSTNLAQGAELTPTQLSLMRGMYNGMSPYVSKNPREAFLNYRDLDIGSNPSNQTNFEEAVVYGSKYFKLNFPRLLEVKTRIDPNNFFRNEQSIPPYSSHK
ncbi:hypothetical protein Tsubulata_013032, partial [Turnera subulata]